MNAVRRGLGNSLVQAFLVVIGLVWLTPLAGLFLSSLRSAEDTAEGGWWTVFASPGELSFDNYAELLKNAGMTEMSTVFQNACVMPEFSSSAE